jgi:SM-20-related protein
MINNQLNFEPYREHLLCTTRVQIPQFLQDAAAQKILHCLQHQTRWTLAERSEGASRTHDADTYAAMGVEQKQALLNRAYARAANEFQFSYDSYMMVKAAAENRDPGHLLYVVLDFLNSEQFLQFARWLTNEPGIYAVNAQATRYGPGQFLTRHEDEDKNEGRAYAYVINLTPQWNADFGGLLQFFDQGNQVIETLMPHYNSLNIFKVPQPHSVSLVAPWEDEYRYAITGWFLRR